MGSYLRFILTYYHKEQLTLNKEWLEQFYKILCDLPDFILDYKGISSYKKEVITYLKNKLDEVG